MPAAALRPAPRPRRSDRLRLGIRLAAGVPVARAAAAEGVAPDEVEALLAEREFAMLVETCRDLQELPEEALLARLERSARCVLELALADGDVRAAIFVLHHLRAGRNPAKVLAQGALRTARRPAEPVRSAPRPAATLRPPSASPPQPARMLAATSVRLRRRVLAEEALRQVLRPAKTHPAPIRRKAVEPAALHPPGTAAPAAEGDPKPPFRGQPP